MRYEINGMLAVASNEAEPWPPEVRSSLVRFTRIDTWHAPPTDPAELDLYSLDGANPINHIDPSGHDSIDFGTYDVSNLVPHPMEAETVSDVGLTQVVPWMYEIPITLTIHTPPGQSWDINVAWQYTMKKVWWMRPQASQLGVQILEGVIEAYANDFSFGMQDSHLYHFNGWKKIPQAGTDINKSDGDGSILSHFFAGAKYSVYGHLPQDLHEWWSGFGPLWDHYQDNAGGYFGADFAGKLNNISNDQAWFTIFEFASGPIKFTDILGSVSDWDQVRQGTLAPETFAANQLPKTAALLGW